MFRYSENCSVIEPKQAIINQNGTPLPRNSITSLTEHFGEMTNTTSTGSSTSAIRMTLWPGLVRNVLLRRVIRHRQPTATSRSMPCPWPPARSQCAYGSVAEFGSMRLSYRPPIWCVSLKSGYLLLYLSLSIILRPPVCGRAHRHCGMMFGGENFGAGDLQAGARQAHSFAFYSATFRAAPGATRLRSRNRRCAEALCICRRGQG